VAAADAHALARAAALRLPCRRGRLAMTL